MPTSAGSAPAIGYSVPLRVSSALTTPMRMFSPSCTSSSQPRPLMLPSPNTHLRAGSDGAQSPTVKDKLRRESSLAMHTMLNTTPSRTTPPPTPSTHKPRMLSQKSTRGQRPTSHGPWNRNRQLLTQMVSRKSSLLSVPTQLL